ncbi:hypothetical protein KP509_10G016000 [Ceratopteris richardii]|uniref:Arf-GAP domain-containing protein n=1 Tax=Ceratopteris richardii TaxID=49495 RepID=A0A8T2TV67_CERRI|nr:hypothetical protein KP509_10G016000 [Ceratopteris richardii]KAH7426764.1 hypothetical protein KP509_10G016000 [Ceratopteris richardii]
MGSRIKEDEKNEKAIRALLRKAPNRQCINCTTRGPQYVCLNFWTFVCTQCSGIHREFTHRVKSISMSKFTSQEVANLEAGGNERGREIFFKDWDAQRHPLPDSSNVERLRDFIKMVYVDKRFSGERPFPRHQGGDREEAYDTRRADPRQNHPADSRSPSYEERYGNRSRRSSVGFDDRRSDDRFGERSPARYEDRRSPARFETDRSRYDRDYTDTHHYNERSRNEHRDKYRHDDRYNEGQDGRTEDRSANAKANQGYNDDSPPIRPVKEILGEDVPQLRVETHGGQVNGGQAGDKTQSLQNEIQGHPSSSFGSVDGNVKAVPPAVRREDSTSLIDFSAEPNTPAPKQQSDPFGRTVAGQSATDNQGWATFDSAVTVVSSGAMPQAPQASFMQDILGGVSNPATNSLSGSSQWTVQWVPGTGAPANSTGGNNWSVGGSIHNTNSQPWNAFSSTFSEANHVPVSQRFATHGLQSSSSSSGAATQGVQIQSSGRAPLPEDIFNAPVSTVPFSQGHLSGVNYSTMGGLGFMSQGTYSQPQRTSNPFDLPGDSAPNPIPGEFPSLSSMQAALPNLTPMARSVPGAGLSSGQMKSAVPSQPFYPSSAPPGSSSTFSSQFQNVPPQIMQPGFGPMGGNNTAFYGGVSHVQQGSESLFSAPSFQALPPQQKALGGTESMYMSQVPGQNFHPNSMPTSAGNLPTHLYMANPGGHQQVGSHSSMGTSSNLAGTDPLFGSRPVVSGHHQFVSHGSLRPPNNLTATDVYIPGKARSQFPTQSTGNPFG